jgi:GNAT superfamily N-acetyltransferase
LNRVATGRPHPEEGVAVQLRRIDKSLVNDFFELHSKSNGCDWCYCVAWWVPTWDGWADRTAAQNRKFREQLFDEGHLDGYLYYYDETPVAWCQVCERDLLEKLVNQFDLSPDPGVWAVTCLLVAPAFRRKGVAHAMLKGVIQDLKAREVRLVQAYPKRSDSTDPLEHWRGPESLIEALGFRVVSADGNPIVYELTLRE